MTKQITEEEKTLLIESKIRTCVLMQETLEGYLLEEKDQDVIKQYQDAIQEYEDTIYALRVFQQTL
jgi:hypothetical protein